MRYDNANDAHAARHHKHITEDETEEIENPFKDIDPKDSEAVSEKINSLWLRFKQEVENRK